MRASNWGGTPVCVEVPNGDAGADWRLQVRIVIGAAFGFVSAIFIGVASADETPTSGPVEPEESLAPAVVVSAGADALNTNAVIQLSAHSIDSVEYGTAFQLDDGRIGTVAHALIDARTVGLEDPRGRAFGSVVGVDSIPVSVDEVNDLAAFRLPNRLDSMAVGSTLVEVGDEVAVAGFGRDGRLVVEVGVVIYRGSGAAYGTARPEVIVISAPVAEGWSGGPVTNRDGEVIAVVVALEQVSGVTIAVPVERLPEVPQ